MHEYDFSQDWENATEGNSYSSSCVVATNEFLTKQNAVVDYMLADIERSVEAVKSDAATCAQAAARYGLADDAKAVSYTHLDVYKRQEMGSTHSAASAIRQSITNRLTATIKVDMVEPTSSGIKWENAVSKKAQSAISVLVRSARSFFPK